MTRSHRTRPTSLTARSTARCRSRRRGDERGQGLVEYCLILVLISIAVIIAVQALGSGTKSLYSNVGAGVTLATGG